MLKRLMVLMSLLSMFFLYGCADATTKKETGPEYVFTYADNQTSDYPTVQAAEFFAELVEERTDGRIKIIVAENAELGDEKKVIEQLRYGGVDFARISIPQLTSYSRMSSVLFLPYLYKDLKHMWAVLDGEIGDEIMDSFEGSGMIPMSWYDAGVRNFYFTEPVYSLADMAGMNIRVQEVEMMEEMVTLLGASPVPMEYGEVYSALETGRVTGAENNWSSYVTMSHDALAKYYLLDGHMRAPELQMISEKTYEKLSEEDREIIFACAEESAVYERELWQTWEIDAREQALEDGCVEIALTEEQLQEFKDAVQPMYDSFDEEYSDLIARIQAAGQEE